MIKTVRKGVRPSALLPVNRYTRERLVPPPLPPNMYMYN